jgi:opacity protein-like surface antigen
MMKSLFAGATALALIAGAAVAQQAYDSTTTRTTTVTAPEPLVPAVPAQSSTTTVERTVAQPAFDPTRTSTYHEEHTKTVDGATVEKSVKTETSSPYGTRSSSYSQTTTRSDGE